MERIICDYKAKVEEFLDQRQDVGNYGYIPIIETYLQGFGRLTVGVDYVVLDREGSCALRMNGDYLDAGPWTIVRGDSGFCTAIEQIAQHYLEEPEQID
jgi:hypothetical protein